MKNAEIAGLFERAADILALLDENTFRIIAMRKIARALEELPRAVESLSEADLKEVPGIGQSSAERIAEYLRTGRIAEFEDLASQVPAGVLEIMRIPTVGPRTAALLWREGGVTSVADLVARIDAGEAGGLLGIKGLGDKKLKKIKQNLQHLAASSGRVRLGEAMAIAEELVAFLRELKGVRAVQYCGSLRRGKETIGDVDIAVSAARVRAGEITQAVCRHARCAEVIQAGASKTSFRTSGGMQVDVRVVPPESFGAAIQYFTGSKEHNVKLRERAVGKGLKLNEWGLFEMGAGEGESAIAGETEEGIYEALGLVWMPPEMREDKGEIEWAAAEFAQHETRETRHKTRGAKQDQDAAPAIALVEVADIKGDLHMHTTASDGGNSIEELVAEARRRGYEYIAITDHSKSQFQANGLKAHRLIEHIEAIHAVAREAARSGILVLAGSEVDILADGSLDYEDELLAKLDWVVASPHAALTQESEPATMRLVRAAANAHVCVIGHPTGRLVPTRRGLEPDMSRVVFAAARNGVALEINANCHRLDLRDVHARMAVEAHVPLCINTDAHALEDFDQMRYGVLTARRAWARAGDVLNTWPVEKFKAWLKSRREQAGW